MLERNEWLSMALGLCLGFVLCGTIVSTILNWPSQPPPFRHLDTERGGHTKGETTAPDLREGKPPLAVQIIQTDRDKEKERREEERADEKAAADDGLVYWTRWLVVVTGGLAVATSGLYLSTRQIARDALDYQDHPDTRQHGTRLFDGRRGR